MSEARIRALLFVSLAVNLLLIGGGAGVFAAGMRLERPPIARGEAGGPRRGGVMSVLSPDSRAKMRGELARAWIETRDLRLRARDARAEVARVASADAYDAAAMSAAFARMREANTALQAAWHEAMASALARLSPDERRAAIAAWTRERRRMLLRGLLRMDAPPPEKASPQP